MIIGVIHIVHIVEEEANNVVDSGVNFSQHGINVVESGIKEKEAQKAKAASSRNVVGSVENAGLLISIKHSVDKSRC